MPSRNRARTALKTMRRATWVFLLAAAAASAAEVYRWTDANGTVHFGDRPTAGAERVAGKDESQGPNWHEVEYVVDGDTVHLADGTKVRFIGLNTPEVAHRGRPAEPGGRKARAFLRERLQGEDVRLEYGAERLDKYDRTLAHIFTRDGTNINRLLLEQGHAHAVVRPPNVARSREYFETEAKAREARRGIWALERYQVHPITEAARYRNTFRRLRGRVLGVTTGRYYTALHFEGGVQARIGRDNLQYFEEAGLGFEALKEWRGKDVTVRGWVHQRKGKPVVRVYHPLQVKR